MRFSLSLVFCYVDAVRCSRSTLQAAFWPLRRGELLSKLARRDRGDDSLISYSISDNELFDLPTDTAGDPVTPLTSNDPVDSVRQIMASMVLVRVGYNVGALVWSTISICALHYRSDAGILI